MTTTHLLDGLDGIQPKTIQGKQLLFKDLRNSEILTFFYVFKIKRCLKGMD